MADTKLLLVEDDENLAYMEKSCFEDIIGGYERGEGFRPPFTHPSPPFTSTEF